MRSYCCSRLLSPYNLQQHYVAPYGGGIICEENGESGPAAISLSCAELHPTTDEHFLAEDLTLDGRIGAADAFYACREEDYPTDRHEDWEYLVDKFDFAANQNPDFVIFYQVSTT